MDIKKILLLLLLVGSSSLSSALSTYEEKKIEFDRLSLDEKVGTYEHIVIDVQKQKVVGIKYARSILIMDTRTGVITVCAEKLGGRAFKAPSFTELIESNEISCDKTVDFVKNGNNPVGTYSISHLHWGMISILDTRYGDTIVCDYRVGLLLTEDIPCSKIFNPITTRKKSE